MIAPTRLFCIYENRLICLFLFTPIKDIELAAGRWLTPRCWRSIQTKLLATNCGPVVCPIWEFLAVASAFRADGERCHSCLPFFLQVKKKKKMDTCQTLEILRKPAHQISHHNLPTHL